MLEPRRAHPNQKKKVLLKDTNYYWISEEKTKIKETKAMRKEIESHPETSIVARKRNVATHSQTSTKGLQQKQSKLSSSVQANPERFLSVYSFFCKFISFVIYLPVNVLDSKTLNLAGSVH